MLALAPRPKHYCMAGGAGNRGDRLMEAARSVNLVYVHVLLTIFAVGFVLVAMMGLRQHRTPQAAFAWLVFTALVPYVGVPAFLALGNRKTLPARRVIGFAPRPEPGGLAPIGHALAALAARSRLPPPCAGNRVEFATTGVESWRKLCSLIEQARSTLDLGFYKLSSDEIGVAVTSMLARKAEQGVRVRLLLDAYGSRWRPRRALAQLAGAGGEVRIFGPLAANPVRGHINLRNHRKMAIADRRLVFSGGVNVGAEYMGPDPDDSRWTDLAYVCEGPVSASHCHVFDADWARAGGSATPDEPVLPVDDDAGDDVVQFMPSGPDIREDVLHDGLVLACHMSQARILIVTPYFLPSPSLSGALSIAARRGVDVQIVVPARSNQRLADLARESFLREMRDSGASVLLHPGMVHAKAAVFDECAFVGTANFDIRSLFINFETMLVVHSAAKREEIKAWAESVAARCAAWRHDRRLVARLSEAVFRLAAPLM